MIKDICTCNKLEWKEGKPSKPGLYLIKNRGQWPIHNVTVAYGDWRRAQNPKCLYMGEHQLEQISDVECYFGPIPPYPRAKENNVLNHIFGVDDK